MTRKHAITPTDSTPPNPQWRYSQPRASRDGRVVWIDAMQLPMAEAHNRGADENFKRRGWK